jgi:hypothetical protein
MRPEPPSRLLFADKRHSAHFPTIIAPAVRHLPSFDAGGPNRGEALFRRQEHLRGVANLTDFIGHDHQRGVVVTRVRCKCFPAHDDFTSDQATKSHEACGIVGANLNLRKMARRVSEIPVVIDAN